MSNGNYNNEGRTPPSMNAVERNMLGWLELEELNAGIKNYELPPISENKAYMFSTENEGELSYWKTAMQTTPGTGISILPTKGQDF